MSASQNENLTSYAITLTVNTHVIVAVDTSDLAAAKATVRRLANHAFAFKIGHALVLPHGLMAIEELMMAGAQRIFLDMKFHDIPNSVALGVYEATRHGVWMMTLHTSGGDAMMAAAVEAAADANPEIPPVLLGVTVLTSIDQETLTEQLGVQRNLEDHAVALAKRAVACGLDGVVCSGHEVATIRKALGPEPVLVTPGIRRASAATQDQKRVVSGREALDAGATYLVIGRALADAEDPEAALVELGL